jgi:uncharacterized peroxidase-related enzyme
MAWVRTIERDEAGGELAEWYRRVGNPDGTVDEVMKVHSLSVDSLRGHFELYVAAMHRPSPLSFVEREIVGSAVSRLNGCGYCLAHHTAGLARRLHGERPGLPAQVRAGDHSGLTARERAMIAYAERLTLRPRDMAEADVGALRAAGLGDREILDLTQVVAYFCYANRIVLGLGATIEPFEIGQHPGAV